MKTKRILLLLGMLILPFVVFAQKPCPRCKKEVFDLKIHMRTHTGEKPYICEKCGKGFAQKNNLKTHIRRHRGEKPYICEKCGKGFAQKNNLKTHMRTHTGEKPYICKECGKGFIDRSNLKKHIRTHTEERPYICKECGKGFADSSNLKTHLKTHLKIHTKEKPYVCNICNKRFTQNGKLERHLKTKSHLKKASRLTAQEIKDISNDSNDNILPTIENNEQVVSNQADEEILAFLRQHSQNNALPNQMPSIESLYSTNE